MKIIKNCLESTQVEIKINYLEKNEIVIDRIKEIKVLSSIKIRKETINQFWNYSEDLKVKHRKLLLKKLTRFLKVQMMIKEYNQLIQ